MFAARVGERRARKIGGLFGIGGSGAKTDRKFQLQSWSDLQSLFQPTVSAGLKQTGEGAKGLTGASNYFQALMSGDPAKMSSVLAPQISGIKSQVGQNIATTGQFAGRSGGTAAQVQQQGFEAQRAIQNLFDILGPEAAKEVAQISGAQEELGLSEVGTGAAAASEVASGTGADIGDARRRQDAQQGAIFEGLGALFGL